METAASSLVSRAACRMVRDRPGVTGFAGRARPPGATVRRPDETFGEVGHAFVEPKPGASLDAAELDEWCRERLANYKTPKRFEVRAELPRLPIGKIDKQALKRELAGRDG